MPRFSLLTLFAIVAYVAVVVAAVKNPSGMMPYVCLYPLAMSPLYVLRLVDDRRRRRAQAVGTATAIKS
jgi:Flp pilus assembly protein TadB